MLVHNQSIQHRALDYASSSRSHIMRVFIVGIVTIVALGVGPACSLPIDGRRLLEETKEPEAGYGGAHFQLLHWSHPRSPLHVPGLSLAERFKYAVQSSRERVAGLSSRMLVGLQVESTNSSNVTFVSPETNLQFEYGMEITLGTPPQRYTGIADTGSDLVWVQCLPCPGCAVQPNPLFNPIKSSTYAGVSCSDPMCQQFSCGNNTCQYQYAYGGGEQTFGELSLETITLNTTTGKTEIAKDFVFGCAHSDSGYFDKEDGLVGLGRGPLSFTSQLGSLYGKKFSYCLVSVSDSSNKSSPLLFGNSSIPKVATQYTPMVENPNATFFGTPTFYYIGLKGLKVDGVALDIPSDAFDFNSDGSGGVFSDSGTSITSLIDVAYDPLLSTMQSLIKYPVIPESSGSIGLDLCYNVSSVPSPKFPNVTFLFDGMSLDLPQGNVFLLIPGFNDTVCMALATAGPAPTTSVFGNVQQQNIQYLHDREENRFGFAHVKCDTLTSG